MNHTAGTRVKICGLRSSSMVEAACAAGADAIGLVFYAPSSRAVTAVEAAEALKAVAPLVTTVGLFVDPSEDEVNAVLERCPLDCLQFHGSESAEFCRRFDRPYIKAVSMRPDVDIAAIMAEHTEARALLFDAWREDSPGGTGDTFAWERLPNIDRPWILAGGLNAANVGRAIGQLAPPAVDVSGGVESAPGEKDPARMRQFIAAVRAAREEPRNHGSRSEQQRNEQQQKDAVA